MNTFYTLARDGLLAIDTLDPITDSPEYKRERMAQCASVLCTDRTFVRKADKPQVKDQTETFCPDCGHALFWVVKKTRIRKKEST